MIRSILRAFDYFVPASMRDDPESVRRARVITGMAFGFGTVGSLGVALRAVLAEPTAALPVAAGLALFFLCMPFVLRVTGRPAVVGSAIILTFLLAGLVIAYFDGGLLSPALTAMTAVPLFATFMIGPRAGLAAGIAVTLFCGAGVVLHRSDLPLPPFNMTAEEEAGLRGLAHGASTILITFFVLLFERERRASDARLRAARREAERASETKSQFLANMSHEIRTPMTAILGIAELLRDADLPNTARQQLKTVLGSAENLQRILDDIFDFSRIEVGPLILEESAFSLRRITAAVAELFEPMAAAKGIGLAVTVDEAIADGRRGDPARLRQVLVNLLGNAVKFTEEGGVELHVVGQGEQLRFIVRDTGIGIAPDVRERIFEPFQQVDPSMSRRFGGTGLGLAISSRLAEQMDGAITVETGHGEGSTFTFSARLEPAVVETPPPESPRPQAPDGPRRILVAEDDPVTRLVAKAHLEALGFAVDTANNGREALDAVATKPYTLVLMDCQMPELDGYEACRRLRREESGHHLPVIAFTAHALEGDREKCLAAGMDDYMTKPFRRDDLVRVLGRWVEVTPPGGAPDPRAH